MWELSPFLVGESADMSIMSLDLSLVGLRVRITRGCISELSIGEFVFYIAKSRIFD
jgi:hypothetical protein